MQTFGAQRSTLAQRIAPFVGAGTLAAAAAYVAVEEPGVSGWFPTCVFHEVTGLWCPGCGLTRGTHALLRGDVAASMSLNIFTPMVIAAIALGWLGWVGRAWGRPLPTLRHRLPRRAGAAVLAVAVVYGVVRNLPGFGSLAP